MSKRTPLLGARVSVLCPGSRSGLGEFDGGVGAQIPGKRRRSRDEFALRYPSFSCEPGLDQGPLPPGKMWLRVVQPGTLEVCPSAHLSWNHSLGWEKLGLVPLSSVSSGQVSLKYLVVSWMLSAWSCWRWSWGLGSAGPPGVSSQPSGGSTGRRAPRPSSHEPAPSS